MSMELQNKSTEQLQYESADAIRLVKENATAKFDETIEASHPYRL